MTQVAFDRFVDPARTHREIWRLIVGTGLIVVVYLIGIAAIFLMIWLMVGSEGAFTWAEKMVEASTPTGVMLLMASFIAMALAPLLAVRLIHKRPVATLFGRRATVFGDFLRAAGIVLVLYAGLTTLWSIKFDAVANLSLTLWLSFLPLALLGLLIQTAAEELIFRGYLMQQLAARFRSPLVWMVLPSLAFGAVHYDPYTAGPNVWLMVGAATAFGFVAADLTRVSGSIGAAWGFHFANNMVAILFLAVDGTIPGLALYLTPYSIDDTANLPWLVLADLAVMLVAWLTLRWVLRR